VNVRACVNERSILHDDDDDKFNIDNVFNFHVFIIITNYYRCCLLVSCVILIIDERRRAVGLDKERQKQGHIYRRQATRTSKIHPTLFDSIY